MFQVVALLNCGKQIWPKLKKKKIIKIFERKKNRGNKKQKMAHNALRQ